MRPFYPWIGFLSGDDYRQSSYSIWYWRVSRTGHPQEQLPVVVKVQLYHFSSGGLRDDFRCVVDLSAVANEWAESVGLVGEQVVCEQYVFGGCENARADEEWLFLLYSAWSRSNGEAISIAGNTTRGVCAVSKRAVRTLIDEIWNDIIIYQTIYDQRSKYCTLIDLFAFLVELTYAEQKERETGVALLFVAASGHLYIHPYI